MFIEVVTDPGVDDMAIVERGQREFERSKSDSASNSGDIPLGALARTDDNTIVGGIKAYLFWKGLEIEALWIAEEQRGQGAGAKLLTGVEEFARSHGAAVAFLTTTEGREFYERHGYDVYGQLDDRAAGLVLYHMKKRL
ncbi:MAG: GNAT family N-acetyltransferase [Gammaproteobacteria bacterium]|nr:GNAT family N-acetyltransferase [Gammaproteobacteria bacterium]